MGLLTLVMALAISGVAAWYSIAGLVAIFSGAATAIIIMGGVLEAGKLVTASWLYNNWKEVPFLLKSYLTTAVVVLMLITSMGIFGFLSKAHLEHSISVGGTNELQISNLERQIARQQSIITDAETVLSQLDQQVAVLIEYDRIRGPTGSIAVRESQSEERGLLNETIDAAYIRIDGLQKDLTPLQQEKLAIEVEVGPLKYIAELIYGDQARDFFDEAVRWVIMLIVFVFDPLAVLLLIAANMTLTKPKSPKPLKEIDAVVVNEIDDDWLTERVAVEEDEPTDDYEVTEWQVVNTTTSKEELKSLLKSVDQKLVDLYTHRNTLENKQEKRSLQRLKKKIIDKLNNEESNE
tara:strand:+ start:426 stop:1475 length:1050 start_codon:yes stop_codon:yes gene_type:complete